MELNKHGAHWFKGSKEEYFMHEDDHRYEELWSQPSETRKEEQISIEHPTTSRRSLKPVLEALLFIGFVCGLATTSTLYALEKSKPEENQQSKALTEDEFSNDPCSSQKLKSTSFRNKELGSRGYSFLVSFIRSHDDGSKTNRTIFVTSETDFNLTVSLPKTQSSSLISISSHRSGNLTMKKLNVHYSLVPSYFTPEYKGIIINTSFPSSLLTHQSYKTSSDTTTVFPVDNLSTFYIISTATPANSKSGSGSHFTIASMKENTLVTIKFAADHDVNIFLQERYYGRGDIFYIILNKHQTFQIGIKADLTGTTINSSNPIAVFGGNRCNCVGYYGFCNMLIEMVAPADKLDNVFIVPPNIHRYQSLVRILTTVKSNIKYTTDKIKTRTTVLKNQFVEFAIGEHEIGVIHSNEPVLVNSFAGASSKARVYGDPFMITVPGINQYLKKYINFVPDGFNFSFATFMIRNNSLENLQINGTKIDVDGCVFHSSVLVGTALYSVCTVSVPSGVIDVKISDGSRFGFIVTGQRKNDGHGYTGNALITTTCGTKQYCDKTVIKGSSF